MGVVVIGVYVYMMIVSRNTEGEFSLYVTYYGNLFKKN